jgi:MFS family permease
MFSLMSGVGIPAPILFGELSDRIGRNSLIILGLLFEGVSFLYLPFVSGVAALYLAAVLFALGRYAIVPNMMALLTDHIPSSKRGIALGLYGSGEDVGLLIGPLVVSYVYQFYGSAASFYLTAGLLFTITCVAIPVLRKIKQRDL